ncbi:MAG: MarR family transcriptional regulator [Bacillota bacterium]
MDADVDALKLRELLRRLVRGIGLLDREDAACCGITLSQCHALGEVATQEGLTPGELAVRLGVDPSAITRITDALVQGGLLSRRSDPSDRRLVRLFLTPEGRSLWDGIHSMMMERSRAVIEHLSPDERPAALAALERLVEALEREGYLPRPGTKEGPDYERQGT